MKNKNLSNEKKTYYISIAILAGMFFIFGFVSWVNSILIPYFRISCRTYTFRILLCSICFLHCLFCDGCSVRDTIKESRLQTRNHVWLYVNCIRSLHICSSRFSSTIRNFPDRFVLHRNRSGNPANGS